MNRAYLFPLGLKIDRQHACEATRVTLLDSYPMLLEASRYPDHRLRCSYDDCLDPVTPVRESGKAGLRCFAHLPATPESPPCPYRAEWIPDPKHPGGRPPTPEHKLRKIIESALAFELARKLAAPRCKAEIRMSTILQPPLIRIGGFGRPIQINCLAPECEQLWTRPFDGSLDGEDVLFFIIEPDVSLLNRRFINEHLLARRPAIVVSPGRDDAEHKWRVVSALGDGGTAGDFATIDLIRSNGEVLFISTAYREAIERIETRLESAAPPAAKLLRAVLARLLSDGTAARPSPAGKLDLSPQDLGVLSLDDELRQFCSGDPLVAPIWKPLLRDAFAELDRNLASLRNQVRSVEIKLAEESEAARTQKESARTLEAAWRAVDDKATRLEAELAANEEALGREKARREELAQSLQRLGATLLGRWAMQRAGVTPAAAPTTPLPTKSTPGTTGGGRVPTSPPASAAGR